MSTIETGNGLEPIQGPTLILIRGLPGTGKTYLAEALRAAIGEDSVLLLDPDAIDRTSQAYTELSRSLTKQNVDELYHPNRFLKARAHEAIAAHRILIWNQPFSDLWGFERTVESLQLFATRNGVQLPLLLVEVSASREVALQRIVTRKQQGGHGPSETRFARFVSDYRSFAGKGYRTVEVSGEDNIAVSVATVLKALQEVTKG